LEQVAAQIKTTGKQGAAIQSHLGKMDEIKKMVDTVMDKFGRIDILVNNAGVAPAMGSVLESIERLWDTVMNLNLKGLYFISQEVAKVMRAKGGGSIINVSSIDGFKPEPMASIYSIAKAGVLMITKAMALELAPYKIRVNALAPGPVSTKLFDSHWFHLPPEEAKRQKDEMAKCIPLGHVGDPDEIVGGMVYLASDASSFVTGATILIDGGILLV
jgi:NAD(P)-dependent dehydrogenase (short-subunit alcohol dehydrogenase family)